jgi:hypothetical protein
MEEKAAGVGGTVRSFKQSILEVLFGTFYHQYVYAETFNSVNTMVIFTHRRGHC